MNIKRIIQMSTVPVNSEGSVEYFGFRLIFDDDFTSYCTMSQQCSQHLTMTTGVSISHIHNIGPVYKEWEEDYDHSAAADLQEYWEERNALREGVDLLAHEKGIAFTGEDHMGDETIEPRLTQTVNVYAFPGISIEPAKPGETWKELKKRLKPYERPMTTAEINEEYAERESALYDLNGNER